MANALNTVNSDGIEDGSIVNADIKSDAAIALSKLASTPAVLTGSTNNTITTVTSGNNIQGEANLTFDGTTLNVAGDAHVSSTAFDPDNGAFDAANYPLVVQNPEDTNGDSTGIGFAVTTAADKVGAAIHHVREGGGSQGDMRFLVSSDGNSITERMRINSSGHVIIKNAGVTATTGLLQLNHTDGRKNTIGTHYASNAYDSRIEFGISDGSTGGGTNRVASISYAGISFGTDTASSTRLDDYEEGTWDVTIANGTIHSDYNKLKYTKIGNVVHISGQFRLSSASNDVTITNLPFSVASHTEGEGYTTLPIYSHENNFADSIKYIVAYSSPGSTQLVFRGIQDDDGSHSIDGSNNGYFMVGGSYFAG